MCLYPIRIRNPAYESLVDCQHRSPFAELSTIPPDFMVDVPCGHCFQCLRVKRYDVILRLKLEQLSIPKGTRSYFLTLTFDNVNLEHFRESYKVCLRRYLDLLRKTFGYFRYYLISELGEKSCRFHFHGILFGLPQVAYKYLASFWRYGISWYGYVTERTCGYITKYMIKQQYDTESSYRPIITHSQSLGLGYNNKGLDYLCKNATFFDTSAVSSSLELPNYVTLPDGYGYFLSRYFMKLLYAPIQLLQSRYLGYQSMRYFFMGLTYPSREAWHTAICLFRFKYTPLFRDKFKSKPAIIESFRQSWQIKFLRHWQQSIYLTPYAHNFDIQSLTPF